LGITTLLLPPLRAAGELRLQRVLDLVLPGAELCLNATSQMWHR